ncbi:MAG TPA: HAMP domain-containing sensor histidine kinase [Geothrix sp.]|nr:HAMP domain-containing sensor histidine kinase [Geothrix sp.]
MDFRPSGDRPGSALPVFLTRSLTAMGAMVLLGIGLGVSLQNGLSWTWLLGLLVTLVLVALLLARWQVRFITVPLGRLLEQSGPQAIEDLPRVWFRMEQENLNLRERAAREENLLPAVMARLEEGVLLFTRGEVLDQFNPSAQRHLGLGVPLDKGMRLDQIFPDSQGSEVVRRAQDGVPGELRLERSGRMLRLRAIPFAPQGPVSGVLVTLDDVTRQEALETTRQKFISNVSHELKTPVMGIRIAAENLLEEPLAEGPRLNAESLLRSVDRLSMLIEDLSELSRIESGALELRPQPLALGAFLSALAEEVSARTQASGVRLEVVAQVSDELRILADPLRLHQILENLLSNAIKFSPPETTVTLSLRVEPQSLTWEVRDQGPGIPEAEQGHIFERFYRAPATRSKPGTGLGLAIVKHLCRIMGGEVTVESQPGQGAAFRVRLPIQFV